jgi:hypothetical protein
LGTAADNRELVGQELPIRLVKAAFRGPYKKPLQIGCVKTRINAASAPAGFASTREPEIHNGDTGRNQFSG